MRILGYTRKNSGPSFHRVMLPLMLMEGVDTCVTNDPDEKYYEKGVDIVMYNREMPDARMEKVLALKEKYGFKICVDVDDYWELDEHHVLFGEYTRMNFAAHQIKHLKLADIVLTTNERLAEKIMPYNPNAHILPNAIPKRGQFDIVRIPHHTTRLFWQGSDTHQRDLEILEQPIESLRKIAGKIKMIMGGYTPGSKVWHQMALAYTAKTKHQYKLIPSEPVRDYYKMYAEADICLVPLVRSRFNGMKSNLKILEAANLALPVIASAVDPYMGMPVNYCRKASDWVGHIKRLVQFPARRREEGLRLKDWVDEHYNFEKINNERRQILEYTAKTNLTIKAGTG